MLKAKIQQGKKGFTIIEVVLVLAIAGLIFMMVFIAFPSLARSQRDTQRKRNLATILTAFEHWHSSHRKTIVDDYGMRHNKNNGFCTFFNEYIDENVVDPSTGEPPKIAFFGENFVVNCRTDETEPREGYDRSIKVDDVRSWPNIEIGDIQYDDTGFCEDDTFSDLVGQDSGLKAYTLRTKLENGGYYCVDNGAGSLKRV